jgi:hypothetical protein
MASSLRASSRSSVNREFACHRSLQAATQNRIRKSLIFVMRSNVVPSGKSKFKDIISPGASNKTTRAPVGRHLGRDKKGCSGLLWNGVAIRCAANQIIMKTLARRNYRIPMTIGLALVTTVCLAADPNSPTPTPSESSALSANNSPAPAMSPLNTASPFSDVQLRMRDLQSDMDKIFAQTFQDFGSSFGQSGFASSVDLRERNDKYVARIYLPNGDTSKVNATVKNGNLDINMNGGAINCTSIVNRIW